jgi:asparagine synthase (glutamine-hydrolysing)
MRAGSLPRLSIELGLAAVVATQLWHHVYVDGKLCDLPTKPDRPEPINLDQAA